jgi:hypothetical protein
LKCRSGYVRIRHRPIRFLNRGSLDDRTHPGALLLDHMCQFMRQQFPPARVVLAALKEDVAAGGESARLERSVQRVGPLVGVQPDVAQIRGKSLLHRTAYPVGNRLSTPAGSLDRLPHAGLHRHRRGCRVNPNRPPRARLAGDADTPAPACATESACRSNRSPAGPPVPVLRCRYRCT